MDYDAMGVAEILKRRYEETYPHVMLMDTLENQSTSEIARLLHESIDPSLIDCFMETELGYGILLGMLSIFRYMEVDHEADVT